MASQTPQTDEVSEAVTLLLEAKRKLATQMQTIDSALANFRPNGSSHHSLQIDPVTPGQYKGMRMTNALESYLKARPGVKIPIDKVVEDLRIGGAEMGQFKRHRQNLKILMKNRTSLVQWDENWTMQLAPTANDPPKPRKKKG